MISNDGLIIENMDPSYIHLAVLHYMYLVGRPSSGYSRVGLLKGIIPKIKSTDMGWVLGRVPSIFLGWIPKEACNFGYFWAPYN